MLKYSLSPFLQWTLAKLLKENRFFGHPLLLRYSNSYNSYNIINWGGLGLMGGIGMPDSSRGRHSFSGLEPHVPTHPIAISPYPPRLAVTKYDDLSLGTLDFYYSIGLGVILWVPAKTFTALDPIVGPLDGLLERGHQNHLLVKS